MSYYVRENFGKVAASNSKFNNLLHLVSNIVNPRFFLKREEPKLQNGNCFFTLL